MKFTAWNIKTFLTNVWCLETRLHWHYQDSCAEILLISNNTSNIPFCYTILLDVIFMVSQDTEQRGIILCRCQIGNQRYLLLFNLAEFTARCFELQKTTIDITHRKCFEATNRHKNEPCLIRKRPDIALKRREILLFQINSIRN